MLGAPKKAHSEMGSVLDLAIEFGGEDRNRTDLDGFAGRSLVNRNSNLRDDRIFHPKMPKRRRKR
jgi:hypothetical protein